MTYDEYINQCKQRKLPENVYTEKHHILPKSKGGRKTKENIIVLTGAEHYIAHKLLAEENPNDLALQKAWFMMACGPERFHRREIYYTAEDYEKLRKIAAQANSAMHKGKTISEEQKRKISMASKGRPCWMKGKHHTEETKRLLSLKNKGRKLKNQKSHPQTEETKQKISNALKGKKHYWSIKGIKRSEETKMKNRQTLEKDRRFDKPVQCVETNEIFTSRKAAAENKGCIQQNISRAVCHPTRTAGGYHWKEITHETIAE